MRHHARVTAFVPSHHLHLDRSTIATTYLPLLHRSFSNRQMTAQVRWLDGGAVALAVAYDADLQAEQGHHLMWINATLEAAQQAGLKVAEAYVTRSISMGLVGGGAGAAGGYKAGGAAGAIVVGAIGLVIGHIFRTHVPIYRIEYSQYYGWQLLPVQRVDLRTLEFGLA
jgi:ribosomal protein L18